MSAWDAQCASASFGLAEDAAVTRVGAALGPKAHVLVCAPSNSALDEIVSRLLQDGLLDWCAAAAAVFCHKAVFGECLAVFQAVL